MADRPTRREGAMSATPSGPIDELAMVLFEELARVDCGSDEHWDDLNEGQKEFYRSCIEGILVKWEVVENAHAELIGPE